MNKYVIPVIAGDGIGPEVIAEGIKVIDAAAQAHDFRVEWKLLPYGADHYLRTGELLSPKALEELASYPAIYFGACGDERVPPGTLEKGLVIAIRNYCDQYVNLRPVKLLRGIKGPLRDKTADQIDFVVVRENTEDFYIAAGARAAQGESSATLEVKRILYRLRFRIEVDSDADEIAYQLGLLSRAGSERVLRYAFELARSRRRRLAVVDKANVLTEIYSFWREMVHRVAPDYPDVKVDFFLIDAVCMWFINAPEIFDVVVSPNMFGDIITEVGAAIQGGLGISPGANINPRGTSMFEPIHGSAPPFKGLNKANPIATIWAGALMLDFLGENAAFASVMEAIQQNLIDGRVRTADIGGTSSTSQVGDDIANRVCAARTASEQKNVHSQPA